MSCWEIFAACPLIIKPGQLIELQSGGIIVCWFEEFESNRDAKLKLIFQSKYGNISTKINPIRANNEICHYQIKDIRFNTKYHVSWFLDKHPCLYGVANPSWIIITMNCKIWRFLSKCYINFTKLFATVFHIPLCCCFISEQCIKLYE